MLGNADDLGSRGRDQYYGYGRVDMYPYRLILSKNDKITNKQLLG
jgi:hypothetical protein